MNFKLFFESSYVYRGTPDKQTLLFDFYMLSHLYNVVKPKYIKFEGMDLLDIDSSQLRLSEDDISIIEHSFETVVHILRKNMLSGVFYAIVRELRHLESHSQYLELENAKRDKLFSVEFKAIVEDLHNVSKALLQTSYSNPSKTPKIIIKKFFNNYNISPLEFIKESIKAFEIEWEHEFGGEAWADICRGWIGLYNSKNIKDQAVWIDHLYDLQHNSGSVLDKMVKYQGWMEDALDFKRDIKSFKDIIPEISPKLRKHVTRILHITGDKSDQSSKQAIRYSPLEMGGVGEIWGNRSKEIIDIFENMGFRFVRSTQMVVFDWNESELTETSMRIISNYIDSLPQRKEWSEYVYNLILNNALNEIKKLEIWLTIKNTDNKENCKITTLSYIAPHIFLGQGDINKLKTNDIYSLSQFKSLKEFNTKLGLPLVISPKNITLTFNIPLSPGNFSDAVDIIESKLTQVNNNPKPIDVRSSRVPSII